MRKGIGIMRERLVVIVCFCWAALAMAAGGTIAFAEAGAATTAEVGKASGATATLGGNKAAATVAGVGEVSDYNDQWPAWRGPAGTGVARHADPPVKWDENTNLKWKVEIPGRGHASPIVWKDRVFVLTSTPVEQKVENSGQPADGKGIPMRKAEGVQKFEVLCLDRKDGSIVWRKAVAEGIPHAATHVDGSWASGSPVTDGERLYAFFGSNGLYCLDMNGNLLWSKDLGKMTVKMNFGEGSSPVLYKDRIIVNWDHEKGSFIVAFDKTTGRELWRIHRDEATSWATPIIAEAEGKPQLIVSATKRIRAYDPATGGQLWECGGMTANVIPCPVASGGLAWMMSGFRGNALVCVQLSKAEGDITSSTAVLWRLNRDTPYVPSPLLYDDNLFFLKGNSEVLSCLDARSGKPHYTTQKLEGLKGVYSSPVAANGHVYVTGRNGVTVVLQQGPEYKVLAANTLKDSFTASAALVGREMFLRGYKSLYCIMEK